MLAVRRMLAAASASMSARMLYRLALLACRSRAQRSAKLDQAIGLLLAKGNHSVFQSLLTKPVHTPT